VASAIALKRTEIHPGKNGVDFLFFFSESVFFRSTACSAIDSSAAGLSYGLMG